LDVDPSTALGSGPSEPTTIGQTTVGQTAPEQPTAQPATAPTVEEVATNTPTRAETNATVPTREEGATTTPPRSSGAGEEIRAPSPARVEEPPVEARAPEGTPGLGKSLMTSSAMVERGTQGEETQASSNDEVEEIQGRPHDGRQHIYVWRQRGDHWAGHEEIAAIPRTKEIYLFHSK